jgi:hypothetical protein
MDFIDWLVPFLIGGALFSFPSHAVGYGKGLRKGRAEARRSFAIRPYEEL